MAPVAPAGIAPGSFNPQVLHEKVTGELGKLKSIGEKIGNPSVSINKLPDKQTRQRLLVEVGSQLNISGKQSELVGIAKELNAAVKAAGKNLPKNTKAVFNAKAEVLKSIGELEVDIASGKYSVDAAFARSKRADKIIRASLQIAESGGLEDKQVALESIQSLKEFKNIPSVALALAKNAAKVTKLETESTNPALLPFIAGGARAAASGHSGGKEKHKAA